MAVVAASGVKVDGTWRVAGDSLVKVDGTWRRVAQSFCKVDGIWRPGTLGQPPEKPIVTHSALGKFTIANYNATLAYTLTRTSGSGGAVVGADGVITVADVNAAFNVTAGYAASAPQSPVATIERKAYTYHAENHQYPCGSHQCNCRTEWNACGCGNCDPYPAPKSQSWGQCGCPGEMCWYNGQSTICDSCPSYCDNWVQVKDPVPAGYADQYGEWSKVS